MCANLFVFKKYSAAIRAISSSRAVAWGDGPPDTSFATGEIKGPQVMISCSSVCRRGDDFSCFDLRFSVQIRKLPGLGIGKSAGVGGEIFERICMPDRLALLITCFGFAIP